MGEFQRSPSKVWWGNDSISCHRLVSTFPPHHEQFPEEPEEVQTYQPMGYRNHHEQEDHTNIKAKTLTNRSNENLSQPTNGNETSWPSRNTSESPNSHKSQDSGFSDSEIAHNISHESPTKKNSENENSQRCHKCTIEKEKPQNITNILLKDSSIKQTPVKNINNFKEKYSPKTSFSKQLNVQNYKKNSETASKSLQMYNVEPLLIYPTQHIVSSAPPSPTNLRITVPPYRHKEAAGLRCQPLQKCSQFAVQNQKTPPNSSSTQNQKYLPSNYYVLELDDNILYQSRSTVNKINYIRNTSPPCNVSKSENAKITKAHGVPRKLSPKVSRNLFSCFPSNENSIEDISKLNEEDWSPQRLTNHHHHRHDLENRFSRDASPFRDTSFSSANNSPQFSRTVPLFANNSPIAGHRMNVSAPVANEMKYNPNDISFEDNESSHSPPRKCHSIENTFETPSRQNRSKSLIENPPASDNFEVPVHHSTPKITLPRTEICLHKKLFNNPRLLESAEDNLETPKEPSNEPPPPAPPSSVAKWMEELSKLYEAECMVTLQSKSLAAHLSKQVAAAAASTTVTIKSLLAHSKVIFSDIYTILGQISTKKSDHLGPLIQSLNGNLTEFILCYFINSHPGILSNTKQREQEVHEILEICDNLRYSTSTDCSYPELEQNILKIKSLFAETRRGVLEAQIQILVTMIEDPTTELALRGAVQGVMWLASQQDSSANNLLIRCGLPRALLTVCLDSKASTLRAAALRAIATVCSTSHAIRQLEQTDGIEIIADILSEDTRPEPELSEAVAVIAQITAPWIDDNHSVRGLRENGKSIINSLTRLLNTTECCQTLLLCAAALANISCMEPSTVWPLLQCHTAEKLLTAVQKRGPGVSVFLKEQTATLIANISAATESRLQLGEGKAVVALLCFLQAKPSVLDHFQNSEHSACLRLQQKSAIALSRLCNERSIAKQVVELGGVTQLVRLCKEKQERSHSDAVLVACLATLRKIASNCGNKVMEEQDAIELVEPRLLDSFLTYSSQNESYV